MLEFEAFVVLKIKEFTFVNDCFQNKNNEEIKYYKSNTNWCRSVEYIPAKYHEHVLLL